MSSADCSPCPSGFFCYGSALTEPNGPCSPGYFCSRGSSEPSPVSRPYGNVCPMGHFCPEGSGSPRPCPVGSFLPEPGASALSQCHPCPPGKYCLSPGSPQPTGLCFAGFFCSGGADTPTPRVNSSLFGCICETLEVYTMEIIAAFRMRNLDCFSNSSVREAWIDVVEPRANSDPNVTHQQARLRSRHYTCSSYKGDICPEGFYCPMGSALPQPCEAGFYCNRTGLHAPAGLCAAGYYCSQGASVPNATPCPAGHYCPDGTIFPWPCPPGTMKNSLGGSSVEECQLCSPGHYCQQRGAVEPSGLCAEGFYCPEGQISDRPQQHVCSEGHFCQKGSVGLTACHPGSYQPTRGQSSCETCPAGFYCPEQGMTLPVECKRGFYCPSASATQHPCPAGTYGNASRLTEKWQCSLCDPGMYCKGTGQTFPSGTCAPGFVCVGGASEPAPLDSPGGFPCPSGFFCSAGTFVPKPCPKGTFSEQKGLVDESQCSGCHPGFYCSEPGLSAVSGPCLPGFYCLEGSQSSTPGSSMFGGICPVGHYCAEGSSVPSPCPAGSYQNETGGKDIHDCKPCLRGWFQEFLAQAECKPCPPGFHCQALTSSPRACPAGYICPGNDHPLPCPRGTYSPTQGLTSMGECLMCPAGQFCASEGLVKPSGPCAAGFLCLMGATAPNPTDNRTGALCPPGSFCQQGQRAGICWAGFYCDWGASRPDGTLCPTGFFCPSGTPDPVPCPAGMFSSDAGNTHKDNCTICPPGHYCEVEATVKPALCPSGYYCPPGLTRGWEFPCPTGTIQSQAGVSTPESCLPCPAGSFCSRPGLSEPTGLCEAGYYCLAGTASPNSTDQGNSTGSHICPSGHYCPPGAASPLPCPPGSLSVSQGLKREDECRPCPPGVFCDRPAIAALSDALPCHAGYVCLGGSSSPTPSDGPHGYLCPKGHSCPVGSVVEVPCEPGTYSPAPGAAFCIICPKGTMCASTATQEPSICPAGHLCPAGTMLPQPCPLGTFSNQTGAHSVSVCMPCPSGRFCSSLGSSIPQGSCLQGFYCQGGATAPTPSSSNSSPENGPCPLGHYCPAGCLSPVPCPLGSIRNTTGGESMESCSSCPAGQYCSAEGLARPSGPCAAGFYCPFDFSSTTPYTFLCPKGHYCPEGSALALPCPTGEYQPNPGSDSCIPCRPGFYCEEAIVGEPTLCPAHSFCPAGTMVPQPCPNGTYTQANQGGLQEERECLPCPPGKFCRGGRIQGVCAAGYLCVSGSADFTPRGPLSGLTQCHWGVQCAGPCPTGFYCPAGTGAPELCPENTFRSSPGGASLRDCLHCPPQHWCKPGDPVLHLCPAGYYCDGIPGSDFTRGAGPRPCPLYTYRASPGAGSKGDCVPCPPGSHCNSTGLKGYTESLCPPGFWCTGSGPPIHCPAGTKRLLPGAAKPSQCEPCAGGTFCPDPRITGRPNVEGVPCRASYQCPVGAVSERLCRAGSYCGPQTSEPRVCPEGYICPEGSHSFNSSKQLCPFPYYCPANSSFMVSCGGGSMPVNTSGVRGSKKSCCRVCEGGTYRPYLSHFLKCLPCPMGYFCPPGTERYNAYPCPLGHVCPLGSSQPVPCPPGFFGNLTHAGTNGDCHPCPAGTFNHLQAQEACLPCGSSSTSPAGSPSCTCIGKNRAFQHSDGSCLCRTGFIFYNELDFKSSTSDSVFDCQPEVYRRCDTGQIRLAASRECVSPSLYSCNVTCGPRGGTLDVEMGICQCERYISAEELCNTTCLSRLPRILGRFSQDGRILLSLSERNSAIWTVTNVLGPELHAKRIGKIHLVQFASEGVFGWIPTHGQIISQFLSEPDHATGARTRVRRDTGDHPVLPRVSNPIICLSTGDMLIFALAINHTARQFSHFPVYQKDHLFNSNPGWDFGAFRRLQILVKQTNFNSTRFAHVFSERGKYVFVDSAVSEWSMVVVVSEEGTDCDPRSLSFQPMTPAQLVRHGIVKQHRLNFLPDWGVIVGVLSLLLLAVTVVTITVLVLQPCNAKLVSQLRTKPKWRSLGEPFCPVDCSCSRDGRGGFLGRRGVGEGAESEELTVSKGAGLSALCDLEEFNVKTLYDKLEDQNLHIASQLAQHRRDVQEFHRSICQHAESLKNVFETMDVKKLSLFRDLLLTKSVADNKTDSQAEAFAGSLSDVLRLAEAILCRLTGDTWQNQSLLGPCDGREREQHSGFIHGDVNMSSTQFSSVTVTKPEGLSLEPDHLQGAAPCISDPDLFKLVSISPLFKTLQEICQRLHYSTNSGSSQHLHNEAEHSVQDSNNGSLIPTPLDRLSPQHSAVFLFGCQMMQLLATCPLFPSVLLLPAKSLPVSSNLCDGALLASCSGDFHFDAINQILYLSEAQLGHVGHFLATILQSMAYITSGSEPQRFVHALREAISVVALQLFNLSFKRSGAECDISQGQHGSLVKEFLNIKAPTEEQFTDCLLASRLQKYNCFQLEQLITDLKQQLPEDSDRGLPPRGTPMQVTIVEEEIDRLNESFLQLSMQLQQKLHMLTETSAGSSFVTTLTSVPVPSHNGTTLLELKRRHVAQRLNELQIRLGQIKQCQQSKDGTRGRSQRDSSFTLQGAGQQPPERDGCSPTGGLWQDGSPGRQSPGQKTLTSLRESHISGPRGCSSGTRSDCLAGQNQRGVDGSGQWESHSQVTIENTEHSDMDELSRADKTII
ncbi:zonadhesin [Takifugu rubripes]|uniref:zonadhesin n=1 Tax=Takifugu rubripes TaxID=31033 RepID=UPI001145FFFC|nr:zonadhesin-like [Takifugu rubripes]